MFKFIFPTVIIGVTIAGFLIFTNPLYKDIMTEREQIKSYDEALTNSKALEAERDKLTQKYNSIDPENINRLQKLLPNNVDNIRLILEIEKVALPYGMVLKDVSYSSDDEKKEEGGDQRSNIQINKSNKDYGVIELGFSTQGTYSNFINFIKDLENNLRIVDITSIDFSSSAGTGLGKSLTEVYTFNFTVKTYWLKN